MKMPEIFKKKNSEEETAEIKSESSKPKKKLSKQAIANIVCWVMLGITHVAVILAIALSVRYYAIYPSLFGSVVGIVLCLLIIVDIIYFVGFNHKDMALKIISCVLAVFLLIGGTVGTFVVAKANGIVDEVLDGGNQKYETFSGTFVSYKPYNTFASLTDLAGKKVGVLAETSNGISYIAKDMLADTKIDYATVEFKTNAEMVQALIDNEIDAMVITSAYREIYSLERDENSPFAKYLEDFNDFSPFEKELKSNSNKKVKNLNTDPFNVLLIGYSRTDIGSTVGLADSIILATVNPQTYEVSMMSIARDSFVPIACYGGEYDKINSGRSTSRACFIETVENFINTGRSKENHIDIDYYMELDYLGLVDIVNTIGGIEINNPVEFELDGIYVPAGKYIADGQQVLQFCRERHHMPGGDFDRQQHQKEAIIAIARKFIESGDVNLALTAMHEASQWMSTDLTLNQLTTVFNLLLNTKNYTSMDTFDLVDFQTLRITGDGGIKYYSYSMHLPLWVYLIYQGSFDESMQHVEEVMGKYSSIKQITSFEFSIKEKYERPALYSLSYPDNFMFTPDPMPAYWVDLEGMTLEEAMAWASGNGISLSVGEIIPPGDSRYVAEMQGLICGQSVRYGSLVSEYKTGTVSVMGAGDINLDDYYVPDFIGKDVSKVLDWAYDHDIEVSGTGGISEGRIVASQDPEPGTPIKDVEKIKVTLKEPEKLTVTFNADGGTPATASVTVLQGSKIGSDMPDNPTKASHAFGGWFTEKEGKGKEITSSTEITSNMTVYAKWVLDITITLNANGGDVSESSIKPSQSLPTPTYIGNIFKGWYDSQTGGKEYKDADLTNLKKDIMLYARWSECTSHELDDGVITTAATCTVDGVLTKTCNKCGKTVTSPIPATGHTPVDVEAKAPTCTEAGYEAGKKCSVCDATISGLTPIDKLGHDYGDWIIDEEATEDEDGLRHKECSRCGDETEPESYSLED